MKEKGFVMSIIIIVFSSRNVYVIIINDSLRKHPFLLALRRVPSGEEGEEGEEGETDVFAGYINDSLGYDDNF